MSEIRIDMEVWTPKGRKGRVLQLDGEFAAVVTGDRYKRVDRYRVSELEPAMIEPGRSQAPAADDGGPLFGGGR